MRNPFDVAGTIDPPPCEQNTPLPPTEPPSILYRQERINDVSLFSYCDIGNMPRANDEDGEARFPRRRYFFCVCERTAGALVRRRSRQESSSAAQTAGRIGEGGKGTSGTQTCWTRSGLSDLGYLFGVDTLSALVEKFYSFSSSDPPPRHLHVSQLTTIWFITILTCG